MLQRVGSDFGFQPSVLASIANTRFGDAMDALEASLLALLPPDFEEKQSKALRASRAKKKTKTSELSAKAEFRARKNSKWRKQKRVNSVRKEKSAVEALKRLEEVTVPF